MFQGELVYLDVHFKDRNDLFSKMAQEFLKKGYVYDGYENALKERENEYPTGIELSNMNVAIPHVDSKYIKKPGIAFVRPNNAVDFKEMCTNKDLKVDLIFMLLVKDKEKQVPILSSLMSKFTDEEYIMDLKKENNPNSIMKKLKNILGDE